MIEVILFDLGGVLIPEMATPIDTEIAKVLGIPNQNYLKKINEIKPLVRKGNITLLDMYSEIKESLDKNIKPESVLKRHVDLYKKVSTKRDDRMVRLIEKLKHNYKVCCITETEKEIAELNKKNGLFSYFAKAYLSIDLGYTKLEQGFYLKILEDLKCSTNEVIVIDDRVDCVAVAESIGIKGVVFDDITKLKDKLGYILRL